MNIVGIVTSMGFLAFTPIQEVDTVEVTEVAAESAEGYTGVTGVHELPDGRVLVVDRRERFVYLLDRELSRLGVVGGQGQGPEEYSVPGTLLSLEEGRAAVLDEGRGRFLVIEPDGTPGGFIGTLADAVLPRPRAADASGRFYARGHPVARTPSGDPVVTDSAAIERWHRDASARDTIAFVPVAVLPDREPMIVQGRAILGGGAPRPPFASGPEWAVSRDGTIGVVRLEPYRAELISPDGIRTTGPPVPFDPVPVTERHREEWREEREGVQTMVVGRIGGGGGGPTVTAGRMPVNEPAEWPETLPPFLPGAASFSPDGELWVERAGRADERPLFDVFDAEGRRTRQIRLPPDSRLVGFSPGHAYIVHVDAVELEWLRRMPLP